MSKLQCTLTIKDRRILASALHPANAQNISAKVREILEQKIESARIVTRDEIGQEFATLNSRVRYRVNQEKYEDHTLSSETSMPGLGLFLPLCSLRASLLVGLAEGKRIDGHDYQGVPMRLELEQVLFQPEAERKHRLQCWEQ